MIKFYISRGAEFRSGSYWLTTYPPKKNKNDMGCWWYWLNKDEKFFEKQLHQKDIDDLGIKINFLECINLQTGEIFTLEEANEIDREWFNNKM